MKKTPARLADDPSSRKDVNSCRGFQMGSPPKIITEEDETIIPMNEVMANPQGIVNS